MATGDISFYATMVGGGHDKFYSLHQEGSKVTKRWGRNGTKGQTQEVECASPEDARSLIVKTGNQKLAKGYEGSFFRQIPDIPKYGETKEEYLARTGCDLGYEPFDEDTVKSRGW